MLIRRRRPLRGHAASIRTVVVLAALLAPALPVTAAQAADATPLDVRLSDVSPTVPRQGRLVLRGVVTNTGRQTWEDINVIPVVSTVPMTTSAEVDQAADAAVEERPELTRLTDERAFAGIGDLAPGARARFVLRIPRRLVPIPKSRGVYWVGVDALGANSEGRDTVEDGRARTFVAQVPRRAAAVDVSVLVPLRATVRRRSDDRLRSPARWNRLVRPGGRLSRLLALVEGSGDQPVGMVVDPAVLDAVRSRATESAADASGTDEADEDAGAAAATDWLDRFDRDAATDTVLGLGYADPDVSGLAQHSPRLIRTAYDEATVAFRERDLEPRMLVVPPSGLLRDTALPSLPDEVDAVLAGPEGAGDSTFRSRQGQDLAFADASVGTGGPDEDRPFSALSMRQRVIAEAALRSGSGERGPLVVSMPAQWNPGQEPQAFFRGLDQRWLRLSGLPDGDLAPTWNAPLPYSDTEADRELGEPAVRAAGEVTRAGRRYAAALAEPDEALRTYQRIALETVSYRARPRRSLARVQAADVAGGLGAELRGLAVLSRPFLTLSGGSGTFVVTLENGLRRTAEVGVEASPKSGALKISTHEPVTLRAGQRTTLRLPVESTQVGVRDVALRPVTVSGTPVGTAAEVTVRSSNVGLFIWAVMGVAGLVLVGAILRRAVRRQLHTRREPQLSRPVDEDDRR